MGKKSARQLKKAERGRKLLAEYRKRCLEQAQLPISEEISPEKIHVSNSSNVVSHMSTRSTVYVSSSDDESSTSGIIITSVSTKRSPSKLSLEAQFPNKKQRAHRSFSEEVSPEKIHVTRSSNAVSPMSTRSTSRSPVRKSGYVLSSDDEEPSTSGIIITSVSTKWSPSKLSVETKISNKKERTQTTPISSPEKIHVTRSPSTVSSMSTRSTSKSPVRKIVYVSSSDDEGPSTSGIVVTSVPIKRSPSKKKQRTPPISSPEKIHVTRSPSTVSPMSTRSTSKSPIRKIVYVSSSDDEGPSTSGGIITSVPTKRSPSKLQNRKYTKKQQSNNVKNTDSDSEEEMLTIDLKILNNICDINEKNITIALSGTEREVIKQVLKEEISISEEEEEENFSDIEDEEELEAGEGLAQKYVSDDLMRNTVKGVDDVGEEMFLSSERQMNELLKSAEIMCPVCESCVEFRVKYAKEEKTFVHAISFYCNHCEKDLHTEMTSEKVTLPKDNKGNEKTVYKNSLRYVLGSLLSGITYKQGAELLRYFCITPLPFRSYNKLIKHALRIMDQNLEAMKDKTAEKVKLYYLTNGRSIIDEAVNVNVVFYGTWITQGRTSTKYGVAFVVEAELGLVLDVHLASSFCLCCAMAKRKFKNEPKCFDEWKEKHKERCDINYDINKPSGEMEAEAAKILFSRSLKRGLRYTGIVCDKDSATYKTICDVNPYEKYRINRINWLDHNAQEIFKKLKDGINSQNEGDKSGKITKNIITTFVNFYRFAVKTYGGNFKKIRQSINALIDHHISTDESPLHKKCPKQWCKYKKSPKWHKDVNNRKYSLSVEGGKYLRNIFDEVTKDEELQKVTTKIQNLKSSLLSKLWNLTAKEGFRGAKLFQFCLALLSLDHNSGGRFNSLRDKYPLTSRKKSKSKVQKKTKSQKRKKRS